MAIVANTYNMRSLPNEGNLFYESLQSEDVSGCEDLKAAAVGKSHYVTKLLIRADAAIDVTVGSGETTGAVTTIHFGPIPLAAASGDFKWEAPPGMGVKCTSDLPLTIDAGAGTVWVEAHGKTCKD